MRQMAIDERLPVRRLYVIAGSSRVLATRFIEGLKEKIKRQEGVEVMFERVSAKEGDVEEALVRLATAPLFGGRPLLLIEDADEELLGKEWLLKGRWGRGVLVVWASAVSKSDKRRLKEAGAEVVDANPPESLLELQEAVANEARRLKVRLTQSDIAELLRRVDRDFDAAVKELEKLALSGGRVADLVADHAPSRAYDLTGAIEEWNAKAALEVVKRSFEEGIRTRDGRKVTTPQDVVVHLVQQALGGLSALEAQIAGGDFPEWRRRRLLRGLQRLGRNAKARIRRAVQVLYETDAAVKSGADPYLAIEAFILQALT